MRTCSTLLAVAIASMVVPVDEATAQDSAAPLRDRVIWVRPAKAMWLGGAPGGPLTHKACKTSTCTFDIEVTVDPNGTDSSGRTCAFSIEADVLVLKKKDVKITWNLKEVGSSRSAKFRDDAGKADGIRIALSSATSTHFKGRDRRDKTFGWQRNFDAADEAKVYLYDINVDHNLGGGRCDVPDPIIVSRD